MDQAHAGIVAAVIAAVSSSAVAIVLAISGLIERRLDRKRETTLKALEHLTGGSKTRSVGSFAKETWFNQRVTWNYGKEGLAWKTRRQMAQESTS